MIINYIESVIDYHQEKFGLYFSPTVRYVIIEDITKGNYYAFNIIYSDDMRVTELKYLDYKLCVHEADTFQSQWKKDKMWSYDGGKRYQWNEMETLIFDPSIIRNIKIESIL